VIVVFLVCFFPIVLNAVAGFVSLSEELTGFTRASGAGVLRAFWKVRLPAALPQCFVAFKCAAMNARQPSGIATPTAIKRTRRRATFSTAKI
jgi:NitT/TauT family transport system permease protein